MSKSDEVMTPWGLALCALASYRATKALAEDAVTEDIRLAVLNWALDSGRHGPLVRHLKSQVLRLDVGESRFCPDCVGFYASAVMCAAYLLSRKSGGRLGRMAGAFVAGWAVAGVQVLLVRVASRLGS